MKNAQKLVLDHILDLADKTGLFTCFERLDNGKLHLISEKYCEYVLDKDKREEFEIGFDKDGILYTIFIPNGTVKEFDYLEELIQFIGITAILPGKFNTTGGHPATIFFHRKN